MKLRTFFFILFLLFLTIFLGWGKYVFLPKYVAEKFAPVSSPQPSPTVESKGEERGLEGLTPRQKVAQLIAVPLAVTGNSIPAETKSFLASESAGVVTLFGDSISTSAATKVLAEVRQETTAFDSENLQPLVAVDHEGGTVQRLKGSGFTKLPSWNEWCEQPSADRSAVRQSARELAQVGVNIVFAPVVDVASQSTPLKSRVCSSNPQVVQDQAQTWIDTFANQGITSVLKHYPGIGGVNVDLHQKFAITSVSPQQEQIFHSLLKKNSHLGVMSTHTGLSGVSAGPCSLNKSCLDRLQLGQDQLLFTDGLEMVAALYSEEGEPKAISQAAVEAIEAGNSVLVFGKSTSMTVLKEVVDTLEKKYLSSPEFAQKVDRNVQKILARKQKGKHS